MSLSTAEAFTDRPWIVKLRIRAALAIASLGSLAAPTADVQPAMAQTASIPDTLSDLQSAAEKGDAAAQFKLAKKYGMADGAEFNVAEFIKWFRKAANQGFPKAQAALAWAYDNAWGVEQDQSKAVEWYQKAADQGLVDAQLQVGAHYLAGTGVDQDFASAALWLGMAAQQGNAEAEFDLGRMYRTGDGLPEDKQEALKWLRKAADQGVAQAQLELGLLFGTAECPEEDAPKEDCTTPDPQEAARWFRLAADQGQAEGQFMLGMAYRTGTGVPHDNIQAYKWISLAASNKTDALRDDAIAELYSIVDDLAQGTKLDPPLPPEPYKLWLSRTWAWLRPIIGYSIMAWMGFCVIFGITVCRSKMLRAQFRPRVGDRVILDSSSSETSTTSVISESQVDEIVRNDEQ